MKVLDIGPGVEGTGYISIPAMYWPDTDIVIMDADIRNSPDIVHDISTPVSDVFYGMFDGIHASHILEHIDREHVMVAVHNIFNMTKQYGEIVILVPRIEYAARAILHGDNSPGIQGILYGGQKNAWDFHKTSFTLSNLRDIFEKVGFITMEADAPPYKSIFNGIEETMYSNRLFARKP